MLKLNLKLFVLSFSIFTSSLCDQTDSRILYALVNPEMIRSGSGIVDVRLIHRNEEFYAVHEGRSHKVHPHNLSPNLRKISDRALAVLLEGGYLAVNKSNEGDFVVNLNAKQLGGGPILASVFYGATKAISYGGMLAAAGAAVGATGGGAVAVAAAGEIAAVTGSGVAAVAIGSSTTAMSLATTGTTVATLAATNTGGVAAVIAGIEYASCLAFTLGMAIPFL